jgi:branched-chain amino acid transport system permease protein
MMYTKVDPFMGFEPGLRAFTAAVLGGIGNFAGAVLGGVLIGLFETTAATYSPLLTNGAVGTEYKDAFVFLLLVILLLIRPQGLMGRKQGEKV